MDSVTSDETIPLRAEETEAPAPPVAKSAEPATAPITPRRPAGGDLIYFTHCHHGFIEARIDRVHDGGKVDLTSFDPRSEPENHRAPYDPTGTKPDSWRFADPE